MARVRYIYTYICEKLIRMAIFMVPIPSNKDPILGTWPSPATGQIGIGRTGIGQTWGLFIH